MVRKVERVLQESQILGEAPHWDVKQQCLYFVDIFGKTIHKYSPSTKKHTKAQVGKDDVSFIIPVEGSSDQFLISIGSELSIVTWDGESDSISSSKQITKLQEKLASNGCKFNDGKTDPTGKFWAGSHVGLEEGKGQFYCLENGEMKMRLSSVTCSNGLAWNWELKKFYYIDSPKPFVFQYDFDEKTGNLSNKKIVFSLEKHNLKGFPDGQCIDTDGNLWVALFGGQRVIKIDPRKPESLLESIEMPAKQITSMAFGGQNLDELYVTTATFSLDGEVLKAPEHGTLYKITGTGSKGHPGVSVRM